MLRSLVPRRLGSATAYREVQRRRWPTKRAQSPQATGSWDPVAASGAGPAMNDGERGDRSRTISVADASRIAGVSVSTLKRWAAEDLIPVEDGTWTPASAAQARVIARMRERGYSFDAIREA